jgi:hypothetical protein
MTIYRSVRRFACPCRVNEGSQVGAGNPLATLIPKAPCRDSTNNQPGGTQSLHQR